MKVLIAPNNALMSMKGPQEIPACNINCSPICDLCSSKCVVCRPYGGCSNIWED